MKKTGSINLSQRIYLRESIRLLVAPKVFLYIKKLSSNAYIRYDKNE